MKHLSSWAKRDFRTLPCFSTGETVLLAVAGCGSQHAIDTSKFKLSVDGSETYKAAKMGVEQSF
jgi:hypothetical protein